MKIEERMLACRVIEKIGLQKDYSKRLGLENKSTYRGEPVCRSGTGKETGLKR